MKNIKLKFISPFIFIFTLQGCMPDSLTKFQKDAPTKAVTAAPLTVSPVAPPDLTTLQYFQVKNITQASTSYHFHKYGAGNASATCEIPVTAIADGETLLTDEVNDILCWLEAEEEQLFFNGVDFQINTPAGVCEYIEVRPYYYWNYQPRNTQKLTASVTCDDLTCGGTGLTPQAADMSCYGDYTGNEGPNCDEGYIVVKTINVTAGTAAAPGDIVTIAINPPVACGGSRVNCYKGPGVDYKVNSKGFPVPIDTLSYNGESINYSVMAPGPLGKNYYGNQYISNFTALFATGLKTYDYTSIGSVTGLEKFNLNSTNSGEVPMLPGTRITGKANTVDQAQYGTYTDAAIDPLKISDSTLYKENATTWVNTPRSYDVNPFYEFSCLNYAHEVKARVRVQVREWNQKFRTPTAINTEVEESAPLRLLKQGLETSGIRYWNDMSNWDTPTALLTTQMNDGIQIGDPLYPVVPTADYGFYFPRHSN